MSASPSPDPTPAVPAFLDPRTRPERRPRRTGRIVFRVVVAVVVVLCAGGTVTYGVPFIEQFSATVTAPDTVAGMSKVGTSGSNLVGDRLRSVARATSSVSAAYSAPDDRAHMVTVDAAAGLILDPSGALRLVFDGGNLRPPVIRVDDLTEVDAGSMGGVVKCGTASSQAGTGVCAWADYGSVGVVTAYGRSPAQTADLLRAIRPEVLHR